MVIFHSYVSLPEGNTHRSFSQRFSGHYFRHSKSVQASLVGDDADDGGWSQQNGHFRIMPLLQLLLRVRPHRLEANMARLFAEKTTSNEFNDVQAMDSMSMFLMNEMSIVWSDSCTCKNTRFSMICLWNIVMKMLCFWNWMGFEFWSHQLSLSPLFVSLFISCCSKATCSFAHSISVFQSLLMKIMCFGNFTRRS